MLHVASFSCALRASCDYFCANPPKSNNCLQNFWKSYNMLINQKKMHSLELKD